MTTVLDATNGAGGNYEHPVGTDRLAVIVPVYNEERTVAELLRRLEAQPCVSQVIIVDDGSTDRTWEELAPWRARASFNSTTRVSDGDSVSVIVLQHHKNQGKGRAIRTGLEHVTCSHVIIQDADLEYDPQEFNLLLAPILAGFADVVYGSRFIGGNPHRILFFWHSIGNKFLTFLSNAFTNLNLTDMETCYKMFSADVVKQIKLKENRFGFEPEVTAKVSRIPNVRIYEVGISYYGRTYAEGKKIGWKDGVRTLWCILKYNTWAK